jgi:hypothetical protein
MLRPMIPLTRGVAVLDIHTQLACLETDAPSCRDAAIGTAVHSLSVTQSLQRGWTVRFGVLVQAHCGGKLRQSKQ